MPSIAFAIPVKKGMETHTDKFLDELVDGDIAEHFHNKRREHGYDRIKVWKQVLPDQQLVVVYLEGPDVHGSMKSRAADEHEFERYWSGQMEELSGIHPDKHAHQPPSNLVFDWHREKGHSRTHHD